MLARNGGATGAEAFAESRVLDQPRGGNFFVSLERRIAGNDQAASSGAVFQVSMLFFGEHRILKERACTLAVWISGDDEHAFDRADVAYRLAGFGEVRRRVAVFKLALDVGISDTRMPSGRESVGDAKNDKPAALAGVEDTGAVAKAASFVAEFADLTIVQVENLYRRDGLRYFLPIRPHVLHRSAAHAARNAAEALDAGAVRHHGARHEFIPRLSGADIEKNFAVFIMCGTLVDALKGNFKNQSRPAGIGDYKITASAEDEER